MSRSSRLRLGPSGHVGVPPVPSEQKTNENSKMGEEERKQDLEVSFKRDEANLKREDKCFFPKEDQMLRVGS